MPKSKELELKNTKVTKEVAIDEDEEKDVDPDALIAEDVEDALVEEDSLVLDDEDVNPFGDKWEE